VHSRASGAVSVSIAAGLVDKEQLLDAFQVLLVLALFQTPLFLVSKLVRCADRVECRAVKVLGDKRASSLAIRVAQRIEWRRFAEPLARQTTLFVHKAPHCRHGNVDAKALPKQTALLCAVQSRLVVQRVTQEFFVHGICANLASRCAALSRFVARRLVERLVRQLDAQTSIVTTKWAW